MAEDERELTLSATEPALLVAVAKPQLSFRTVTQLTLVSTAARTEIHSDLIEAT